MQNSPATVRSRVDWVDYAKGITIILVVLLHSASEEFGYTPITTFNQVLGPIRIPFFFLIAGLFIRKSVHGDLRTFLRSKVGHFLYLYVLWSVIKYFLDTVPRYYLYDDETNLGGIFTIFIKPPSTLWFIYALLVFFIIARVTRSFPKITLVLSLVAYIGSGTLGGDLFIDRIARYLPFFLIGAYFSRGILRSAQKVRPIHLTYTAAFFAFAWLIHNEPWLDIAPIKLLVSLLGIAASTILTSQLTRVPRMGFLTYVGERSLAVYVMHFIPLNLAKYMLPRLLPGHSTISVLITVCLGVGVPLIIAALLSRFQIRWPLGLPEISRRPKRVAPRPR